MKSIKIVLVFILLWYGSSGGFIENAYNLTCGKDNSRISVVYEGVAKIGTYPWMGYLFYTTSEDYDFDSYNCHSAASKAKVLRIMQPSERKRYTTAIVLVTRQMALGTATEIDKLPKIDFRARARAVFGHDCSGPSVPIRDYTYHPDYETNTYSALAMVQLETDFIPIELQPICPPPAYFEEPQFFAMTLSNNCNKPVVKLYEMEYVDPDKCKNYYRRSGLDISSLWPTHTACARAISGGECVWRSGAVLAMRQAGRWRLVGFGVYGPGCGAPARFLDYGVFHSWVRRSIHDIGKPAITKLKENVSVLRRTLSGVQRFGPCDPEERRYQIYSDVTWVAESGSYPVPPRTAKYNMTIVAGIEYTCVLFEAKHVHRYASPPSLRLRRWCAGAVAMCKDLQFIEIDFYVEIKFKGTFMYKMEAFGQEGRVIDVRQSMKYINEIKKKPSVTDFK